MPACMALPILYTSFVYVEAVVAESVVVTKKLLQLQPKENKDLIRQVAKLADKVQIPSAKASVLWLVGEYCNLVPKIAPDVLRKAAKHFCNEVIEIFKNF